MDISVIIVNYNTFEYTKNAVISVLKELAFKDFEIIIVDNDSKDKSGYRLKKYFKKNKNVKVFKSNRNLGFSKANNLGYLKSKGKYVLFLNSDTLVKTGSITKPLEYLENVKQESILSCKLVLEDEKLDHACKRGLPTIKNAFYYFTGLYKINPKKYGSYTFESLSEDETGYVEAISGAYMLMKSKTFKKLKGFDESYFMYAEDLDFCKRAGDRGIKVIYYPNYEVIHYKKRSREKRKYRTDANFYKSMWIYYKKHFSKNKSPLCNLLVFLSVNFLNLIENIKTGLNG